MLTAKFNYHLPQELIAQQPIKPRDQARLLILDKKSGAIQHQHFYNLVKFLNKGDALVLNNSKVIPARLIGKKETGGRIEIFLLQKNGPKIWLALVGGKIKIGQVIILPNGVLAWPQSRDDSGRWLMKFNTTDQKIFSIGITPVPPYIKKTAKMADYQTIYAKTAGSVAAPTAGLHFTPRLIKKLRHQGIKIFYVTLHVGLGTFKPVKTQQIEDHVMHPEFAIVDKKTAAGLNKIKKSGGRIVACGTTTTRTLEALSNSQGQLQAKAQWINIFMYPGYKFKFVDAMVTNFHLPQSTLIMLVAAFAGTVKVKRAYEEAIKSKYRFYSFGDAMLII